MSNKNIEAVVKELFIRSRKLNISLVFITQSYFAVSKDVGFNSTHYSIMKINKKRELKNVSINHSADIDYKYFVKIYEKTAFFFKIDTALPASDPLRFRKNLFISYKNNSN